MSAGPPEARAGAEAVAAALPAAFLERLPRALDEPWRSRALAAFARPRPVALRVNALRAEPAAVRAELDAQGFALAPQPFSPLAFVATARTRRELGDSDAARRGAIHLQGLSSQLAPLALEPRPGERVLDLCAAPGSKTSQLAALMEGRGELVAGDRSRRRLYKLRAVLEAQGATWVEVRCARAEALGRRLAGRFDRVLVDAPCSGEGRFRLDEPETFADWKPSKVKRLAHEQQRILEGGAAALAPGGVLVYSTCTLAPEEGECVVARVLRRARGALVLEELPAALRALPQALPGRVEWGGRALDVSLERARRIAPDGDLEGFFIARLRRIDGRPAGDVGDES